MRTHACLMASVSLAVLALCAGGATAAERTGQEIVTQVCADCHAEGKDGAPRIGDMAAWLKRTPKGLVTLTEHAITGFGNMPAHGGQPSLSDLEMSRAVAFMVSAGYAADPAKPYASPSIMTGEQLVQRHCQNCHVEGLAGAPRLNNFDDWRPRLLQGMDPLVRSAMEGHKAMPARAGLAQLGDTDLRAAVVYMVVQSASYRLK